MISIKPATVDDAEIIRSLAEATWWPTYSPILSKEQISYMLNLMYGLDTIQSQITNREQTYIILYNDDAPKGFAAYAPRAENKEIYKLHKIYCLPETKDMGFGKALLQAVEDAVLSAGKNILELNVNKYNPAIGFYLRQGFIKIYEEDIDIGEGYQMNDYVMQKILTHE
ncbi:MAG: GNAT family N-acetyltransferase [Bacteroidetes bacterium]|nr:GNAT family N-acetyltransferase [Bacteroidota bacterium]